jgi:hypothetical protein
MRILSKEQINLFMGTIIGITFMTSGKVHSQQLENFDLKNKWIIGANIGHSALFSFSSANPANSSINISDYHKRYGLVVSYYPWSKTAVELGLGLILIPEEKSIDSISWTQGEGLHGIRVSGKGGGGAGMPITAGIRKVFLNGPIQPYCCLAAGMAMMKIGSGTGTGSIDDGITQDINMQTNHTFYFETGLGVQLRLGRVVSFDIGMNGYGTPIMSTPIGNCRSYSGWYISAGGSFTLNPRK